MKMRQNLVDIPVDEGRTICQSVIGKHNGTRVIMHRVERGHGVIGGPFMRALSDCVGFHDLSTKIIGRRRNLTSVTFAAFKGLTQTVHPRDLAMKTGLNYYHFFEPAYKEDPMTEEELKQKSNIVANYIQMANKQWQQRELQAKANTGDVDSGRLDV